MASLLCWKPWNAAGFVQVSELIRRGKQSQSGGLMAQQAAEGMWQKREAAVCHVMRNKRAKLVDGHVETRTADYCLAGVR